MTGATATRSRRMRQMSEATLGMLLMGGAMALLPVSDTFSKLLTDHLTPIEVTFARLLAQGLFLVPAALVFAT